MKALRDIRILPVVLVAIFGLSVLKVAGLVLDGGYVFDYDPKSTKPSWAQENFNFPGRKPADPDITGSVKAEPKKEEAKPVVAPPEEAKPVETEPEPAPISAAERAILERLQARRQELEARAREVEIRESLLKAAEKRIESRVQEMKATEGQAASKSGEEKSEADAARFKSIVTMYESMKPKDAAKIFDRLEMPVLIEIATQMAPRKMSDVLGLMTAEAAEKLTVEMARRAAGKATTAAATLPKIEGRPVPPKP